MRYRKGNKCAFLPCSNYKNLSSASFFSYPRNMERCHQWIVNSNRLDLLDVYQRIHDKDDTYFYRNYNLCSRHFEDNCFMNAHTRNRLVRNAVPTIFPVTSVARRGPGRPPGRKSKLQSSERRSENSKHSSNTITSSSVRAHLSASVASKRRKNDREICYDAAEGLCTTITAADAASATPVVINMPHNMVSPVIINVPGAKNSPLILSLSEDKVWTNVNPASGRVEDRKSILNSRGRNLSLSETLRSVAAAANGTNSTVRSARPSQKRQLEETVQRTESVPILMTKRFHQVKSVSNVNLKLRGNFNSAKEIHSRSRPNSRGKFGPVTETESRRWPVTRRTVSPEPESPEPVSPEPMSPEPMSPESISAGQVVLTIDESFPPKVFYLPAKPSRRVHFSRKRSLSPDGASCTDDEFDESSDSSCGPEAGYYKRQKVIHLSSMEGASVATSDGSFYRTKRLKKEPLCSDGTDHSWTEDASRTSPLTREARLTVRNPTQTSSISDMSAGVNRAGVYSNRAPGLKLVAMDKLLDLKVTRQSRIAKRAQLQNQELQNLDRLRIAQVKERWKEEKHQEEERQERLIEWKATRRKPNIAGRHEVRRLASMAAQVAYETRDCSVVMERSPTLSPPPAEEERLPSTDHSCLYLTRQLRRFRPRTYGTTDRTPSRVSYPGPAHSAGEVIRLMDAPPPLPLVGPPQLDTTPKSRRRIMEEMRTKCKSLDREIDILAKEKLLLFARLNVYRKDRHLVRKRIRKQLSDLRTTVRKYSSEHCALEYLKERLPSSTFKFFKCQLLSCKCPQWDFDSMQIPVIAKRCGLGVRETLFTILRMPTLRTFTRYRNILLKDPSAVEDGHIVKNDLLNNKYRRKIIRKRVNFERNINNLKSVSEILLEYVKKNNVEISTHEQ